MSPKMAHSDAPPQAQSGNGAIITPMRRFPPPWTTEEHNDACFIVRDKDGQALGSPRLVAGQQLGRRATPGLVLEVEVRMAANFAKLPGLLRRKDDSW
jgi:hypothetical protein